MKLTARQAEFVRQFLVDRNATQAAIRAGFAEETARQHASRLLSNVNIMVAIEDASLDLQKRVEIDQEYVVNGINSVVRRCMQEVRPILDRKGEQVQDTEGQPVFAFDSKGALKGFELLAKHLGILTENVKHTIARSDATDAELDAEIAALTASGSSQGKTTTH